MQEATPLSTVNYVEFQTAEATDDRLHVFKGQSTESSKAVAWEGSQSDPHLETGKAFKKQKEIMN
jgi:phage-related protein